MAPTQESLGSGDVGALPLDHGGVGRSGSILVYLSCEACYLRDLLNEAPHDDWLATTDVHDTGGTSGAERGQDRGVSDVAHIDEVADGVQTTQTNLSANPQCLTYLRRNPPREAAER